MIRSKPRKSKAESQRRGGGGGGKRGVCHTEHALCTNFLLSSSWQKKSVQRSRCSTRSRGGWTEETLWIQLKRIGWKRRNYFNIWTESASLDSSLIFFFALSVFVGEQLIETDINLLRVTLKSDLNICLKDERLEAFFSSRVLWLPSLKSTVGI